MPLLARPTLPVGLLAGRDNALWFSSQVQSSDGDALLRRACTMNLAAIVSKRIDTPYTSAPLPGWRKFKCPDYVRP
jgi:ATP-dependent DNA ligase